MHGGVKAPDAPAAPAVPRPSQVVMEPSQPSRVTPLPQERVTADDDPGPGKRRAGTYVMIGGGVVLATVVRRSRRLGPDRRSASRPHANTFATARDIREQRLAD